MLYIGNMTEKEPTLANRLKERRARDNLTQEDLARKVGVTRQTIISIEKGEYVPSLLLAMKIARIFRLQIEDIFKLIK